MSFVTNRVTGAHILQTNCRADVASQNLADIFTFVGVHLQKPANALGPSPSRAKHRVSGLNLAGINTNESQLADEGISHDFEGQRGERLFIVWMTGNDFAVVRIR